jgi:hypothetical protein
MDAHESRGSRYFPARCVSRHAPFLVEVAADESVPSEPRCPICGGEAKLIPTAYYTALTRSKFDAVADSLHAVQLSPAEARALADSVFENVNIGTRDSIRLALRCAPKLRPLEIHVPNTHREVAAFVALLKTLLEVYADHGRFSSDMAPRNCLPDREWSDALHRRS